jgi:hypothetical protein
MPIGIKRRLGLALGLGLSLALACLAAAPAQAQPDKTLVRIILIPEQDGMRAAFRLSRSVMSFEFEWAIDQIRSRSWSLRTPGLALRHGAITAANGDSFREFQIVIAPDMAATDRTYPALSRVGPDGLVIYTPYLLALPSAFETIMELKPPPRTIVVAGTDHDEPAFGGIGSDRYVYIGPRDYVTRGLATFVIPPDLPPWIGNLVEARLGSVLQLYQTRLGRALPEPPTVMMTFNPAASVTSYRGDVSSGRIMSLRFQGPDWEERGTDDSFTITHLIAHEAFHFWNGHLFIPRQSAERPWLHEGAAEYVSLLAERALEEIDEDGLRDELQRHLNGCITQLGPAPLNGRAGMQGTVAYDCGVVIEWLIDLSARRASGGERDILDVWREIFDTAVTANFHYDEDDLLRFATADDRLALNIILDGEGTERWRDLPKRLRALGIAVEPKGDGLKLAASGLSK